MGFIPIGDDPDEGKRQKIPFSGSYNGNSFAILGLFVNQPCCDNIGMFGMIVNGAKISNLRLENVNITGQNKTGGLVGYSRDSLTYISHCHTKGTVSGNRFVGGLIGYNLYGAAIDYCYSSAAVHGNSERIGGLVGYNYSCNIQYCYATGNVTGKKYIGGLVGFNNELSTLKDCNASGAVTATDYGCGGLAGANSNSTITNCYASGNINGGENTGGLVGEANFSTTITYSHATGDVYGTGKSLGGLIGYIDQSQPVSHCYALGKVSGSKWYFGGLIGQCNNTRVDNCYAKGNINPDSDSRAYCGGLIGRILNGYVFKCFASGNVNNGTHTNDDTQYIGGLVGEVGDGSVIDLSSAKGDVFGYRQLGGLSGRLIEDSRIQNCYATGETNGYGQAAGLAGYFEGGCTIKYCYATGKITVVENDLTWNGIVSTYYGDVNHSYYDKESTGIITSNPPDIGIGRSTSDMKRQSTYQGWGFGNYWDIDPDINNGYPYLIGTPQQIDGQIVWEGTSDSDWSNSDNWNFGFVPGMDDDVLIPDASNDPIISATDQISIKKLTVNNNASLTLESTSENTAKLIVTNQSSGNIKVQCFLESNNYHFVHIPVNTGSTTMKNLKTVGGDFYMGLNPSDTSDIFEQWNEAETNPNSSWADLLHGSPPLMDDHQFDMSNGYGYFNNDANASGEGNSVVFVGEVNTGSVSFYNSYTEAGGEGYHVIGNPYTSTISINNFADPFNNFLHDNSSILHDNYEAVYLWKTDDITNDASNDYKIICNCGFTGVGDSSEFVYDFLEPCQGFTVRIGNGGNIIFKPEIRKHASSMFFKSQEKSWPGLQLFAESSTAKTSTLIGFHESMTKWVDRSFDVVTLKGNNGANLYSRIYNEHEHFAVQSAHTFTDSIICGIDVIRPGEYTFSIYQKSMIDADLKDTETGETTNMLSGSTYTVYLPQGNYENRFVLYLTAGQNTNINDHHASKGKIYSYSKTIYLNGIKGLVEIFDINGCHIKSIQANGYKQQVALDEFADGVYIVKTANSSKKLLLKY